ncbi:DUF1572 family protein [Dyadobacter sandarakinus]|uniref:DUF1572 family protein n=1 Tax=Dyadobacter sandarakinus TaxID=2747268 RepID=A0ABX7I5N9_9BACT|nr:DUF1572 family protein [Dyadobacter sandarakinus]QRR01411.1 DUF1572 family protein [Dyadobacter sandarakinus]
MNNSYLSSAIKQFEYYKMLGDKAMAQVSDESLFWQYNPESNSIAMVVNHLAGNMLSRFTDFLTTDGEKTWRNRDLEFEPYLSSREQMIQHWNNGWDCLLSTLRNLDERDLEKIVYIRNEGHTVIEAINRQLAHYPYHIGQIVYVAKMVNDENWKTLSIARKASDEYNARKFNQEKGRRHFTDNP